VLFILLITQSATIVFSEVPSIALVVRFRTTRAPRLLSGARVHFHNQNILSKLWRIDKPSENSRESCISQQQASLAKTNLQDPGKSMESSSALSEYYEQAPPLPPRSASTSNHFLELPSYPALPQRTSNVGLVVLFNYFLSKCYFTLMLT
jgi:hypothetical protein